ncbi:arsenite methyltransferase [Sunxiuqinia sp. sy24]|uniref:arsenite methyltransferase n=1 Tax=Sunxiuqinia sp. sy24 TaxID=3461495 RepID=UPI0040453570
MKAEDLKRVVKEKYGSIANQSLLTTQTGCCSGTSCCGELEFSMIGDEYQNVSGYNQEADLGLGCGLPTEFAGIEKGNRVLDLGSGAGNDCFVARSLVGEEGTVTGIDFTEAMIQKARQNLAKTGFENIDFILGDIENMPLEANTFDVVISNCVLNLVPDKFKAFSEIYRVLKPGGHFCISDVVITGTLPDKLKEAAELYAGCVAGALPFDDYLTIIRQQGFSQPEVKKQKKIEIPEDVLLKYLSKEELEAYQSGNHGIFSITLNASK